MAAAASAEAAGQSRFASYDNETDCVAAHTIAPALCRTAFANARSEYEAKTPTFPSEALCTQHYASCMAWPPGGGAKKAGFRPSWDGVDIVDTPSEHSVTPSPGSTGRAIRFAARPLTAEPQRDLLIRGAGSPGPALAGGGRPGRPGASAPVVQRASGPGAEDRALGPSPPPPPGSGFKLENGVLTYPAPERFQPRNLPKFD